MAIRCRICSHPSRQAIEAALRDGVSNRTIAARPYEPRISIAALSRHESGGHIGRFDPVEVDQAYQIARSRIQEILDDLPVESAMDTLRWTVRVSRAALTESIESGDLRAVAAFIKLTNDSVEVALKAGAVIDEKQLDAFNAVLMALGQNPDEVEPPPLILGSGAA